MVESTLHQSYMELAFKLARKGKNLTFPNPKVGALVCQNEQVVGQGWHEEAGKKHAEVNALKAAGPLAKDATLYVTLEPCSSWGKTPPCTDAIIKAGIKRVFFGAYDENQANRGKAEELFRQSGIQCHFLDFQKWHEEINPVFIHCLTSPLPFVRLKVAMSIDGMITDSMGQSKWITGSESRTQVQYLRGDSDGVLIGASTFNIDNPALNIRLDGERGFKDPVKIVISKSGQLKKNNRLLTEKNQQHLILVVPEDKKDFSLESQQGVTLSWLDKPWEADGRLNLKEMLLCLREKGVYSLLVEGGSKTMSQFLKTRLFNELHVFIAPKLFGKGTSFSGGRGIQRVNDSSFLSYYKSQLCGEDMYLIYRNTLEI